MSYWLEGHAKIAGEKRGVTFIFPVIKATEEECWDHFQTLCEERGYENPELTHWGET